MSCLETFNTLAAKMYSAKKNQHHAIETTQQLSECFASFSTQLRTIVLNERKCPFEDSDLQFINFIAQIAALSQSAMQESVLLNTISADLETQRRKNADEVRTLVDSFKKEQQNLTTRRNNCEILLKKTTDIVEQLKQNLTQSGPKQVKTQQELKAKFKQQDENYQNSVKDCTNFEATIASRLENDFAKLKAYDAERLEIAKNWTESVKQLFRKFSGDLLVLQDAAFMGYELQVDAKKCSDELGDCLKQLQTSKYVDIREGQNEDLLQILGAYDGQSW
ncbi:Hypothetical_protein [Hexamita inflata]|uniref:Hypothetical_protein n=1 Tax=Hexamita inflata TaxID=28002 RepID=A0AA86TPB4_9EUKA|nr:Hypothetical protein HINF_LOCUS9557 [Hexamita inflata]CAI9921916.1 Hypothetical protein HINF_LOCUS9561 [Hexamita inflata]